jgi:hypothetical protein
MTRLRFAFAVAGVLLLPLALQAGTTVVPFTPYELQTDDSGERAREIGPDIVTDGTTAAAVWNDGWRILLTTIDLRQPVSRPPVVVADDAVEPSISASPGQYLVVWHDEGKLMARRYSRELQPLDEPFKAGWGAFGGPARIAFNGTEWLIVFPVVGRTIGLTRVSIDGQVLSERQADFDYSDTVIDVSPDVAWDGTDFIVTWNHFVRVLPPAGQKWVDSVHRATVDSEGKLSPPVVFAVTDFPIPLDSRVEAGGFGPARVAAGGGRTLAVWSEILPRQPENGPFRLFGIGAPRTAPEHRTRRRAIGGPTAGEVLATSLSESWYYLPIRTETGFEVVWGDSRTRTLHRLVLRDDGSREEIATPLHDYWFSHVLGAVPTAGGPLAVMDLVFNDTRLYWIVPSP